MVLLLAVSLLLLGTPTTMAAGLQVKVMETAAAPLPLGDAPLRFAVTDAQGAPVTGARVSVDVSLPAVPHVLPKTVTAISTAEPGVYAAYISLSQDGLWKVDVTASAAGETARQTLELVAGTGEADHSVRRYVLIGVGALAAVVVLRVVWLRATASRARKAG
jgi:hypothetical protein